MKIIKTSILAFVFGLMSFSVVTPVKSGVVTTKVEKKSISWKVESIDVGEIPQGKPKSIVFEFKNTGDSAIIITNVVGSCGCTATDYSKEPILPGKSTKVTATYNAANKGAFNKTVTVTTNAETTPKILTLKGVVI